MKSVAAAKPLVCETCGESKPRSKFRRISSQPSRYAPSCLLCEHEAGTKVSDSSRAWGEVRARDERRRQSEYEIELARRVLARRRLLHFIRRFQPKYLAGWVHEDICRRLEKFLADVAAGLSPRLMLFMPPRHGKSLIASDYFPSWALGQHPEFEIIASSYAVSLPIGFSRKVRARLREPAYQQVFPNTRLDPENENVEGWSTTAGGGYVPAGVGGGITGKGAHILIIDDPIKDAEEADSETVRESIWDWYGSTAYTRLAPGGGVLIIQTRWHDADLSGRLIQQAKELRDEGVPEEEIDKWEIVSYPAIAEQDEYQDPDGNVVYVDGDEKVIDFEATKLKLLRKKGEALHLARFPLARLNRIKRAMQPRHWSALYQQNPVPDEGAYFKKDMFRFEVTVPDYREMHIVSAWDLAIGQKQRNDFTVGVVGAIDYQDNLHIIDVIRGKWDSFGIVEAILNTYARYRPQLIGIEKGQLEQAIRPILAKRMRERRLYPTFDDTLSPITDKEVRARPLQGRMQQGMIIFPQNQPWVETVQHEMLRFPGGAHDDIVDALAWLVRIAMKIAAPRPPKPKKQKSWKDKLRTMTRGEKNAMAA